MKVLFLCLLFLASCSSKKEVDNRSNIPTPTEQPNKDPKYTVIESGGVKYHTGLIHTKDESKVKRKYMDLVDCSNLPDSFDLRTLDVVPPVRDQGQCGSCWAFSKTASLESAVQATGGKMLDLSEQQLVSCDEQQYGCSGGNLDGFSFQIKNGEALESEFPYTASDSRCKQGLSPAAKGVSYSYIGTADRGPTNQELMCALYTTHTIPWITVSATNAWGYPPKSETEVYSVCRHGQTNHAVGVVGWFKEKSGKIAFIMRNSWGTSWGDKGYMSLELGCDSFGDEAAIILVK